MTGGSEGETITLQEAADRLGVHYQTAYKWVRDGTLAAEQVGRSYRLTTAEVDRWADASWRVIVSHSEPPVTTGR